LHSNPRQRDMGMGGGWSSGWPPFFRALNYAQMPQDALTAPRTGDKKACERPHTGRGELQFITPDEVAILGNGGPILAPFFSRIGRDGDKGSPWTLQLLPGARLGEGGQPITQPRQKGDKPN
jgi:hypothetical protein